MEIQGVTLKSTFVSKTLFAAAVRSASSWLDVALVTSQLPACVCVCVFMCVLPLLSGPVRVFLSPVCCVFVRSGNSIIF